jgi:hypothetical protein
MHQFHQLLKAMKAEPDAFLQKCFDCVTAKGAPLCRW